jgi:threonine synthase
MATASTLCCRGCGRQIEAGAPFPFRCPDSGNGDVDHLLRRRLESACITNAQEIFSRRDGNPFVRYRELLHSYQSAQAAGLTDDDWIGIVERLDAAVAEVDDRSFQETPFFPVGGLADQIGVNEVWIKDESGNVSGSHKGRHLMGVMLWLEAAARLGLIDGDLPPLAIASCGNAALAAAVVARAAGRRLEVFVPTHANPAVLEQLIALGAHLHTCPRVAGEAGDPCYLRFREALAGGSLPFTCQGNENGLTLDGGKTLAWEMVSSLNDAGADIDRVFLHVGGGALASSVIEGLREAHILGALKKMPVVHAVQTRGAYPLVRCYERLSRRILEQWGGAAAESIPEGHSERAALIARPELGSFVAAGLDYGATHRSEFMWPWEEEPQSIADGILDDETYDWLAVVEGMFETGGWPLIVSEQSLVEANKLVRSVTDGTPCHTGTAGVAGGLACGDDLGPKETVTFLVTGIERG